MTKPKGSRGARGRIGPPVIVLVATIAGLVVLALGWAGRRGGTYVDDGIIALNLLAGRGFALAFHGPEAPTAAHAPLEPFVLYGVHALFGIGPASAKAIVVLRALLHGLLPLCAWPLARRVASEQVAAIACAVLAFDPGLMLMAGNTGHLDNRITLSLPLMLLAMIALCRCLEAPTAGSALTAGLAIGAAALSEPPMLVFSVAPLALLVLSVPRAGALPALRRMAPAGALLLGIVLAIGPWCVRNRLALGRWVPVRSSFGLLFWVGNNPVSTGLWEGEEVAQDAAREGRQVGAFDLVGHPAWFNFRARDTLAPATLQAVEAAREADRDRILLPIALRYIAEHPVRFLNLSLHRAWWFISTPPHRTAQQSDRLAQRVVHVLSGGRTIPWWVRHGSAVVTDLWTASRAFMALTFLAALVVIVLRPTPPLRLIGALLLTWLFVFGISHAGYAVYRYLLSPFVIISLASAPGLFRRPTSRPALRAQAPELFQREPEIVVTTA